jgi:transaldolase
MKIFLDTANLDEIKEISSWGIVDGVTTNPTLLSREEGDPKEILYRICETVQGPVSAEVIAQDADGMIKEARELTKIHDFIVIKIPMTVDGLKATKVLAEEGVKVNMTLIFSPSQALLAAKVGATYISPFIGRLDDISTEGMDLIAKTITILDNYGFDAELLVASVRHPLHVVEAALLGADIVTVPPQVLRKLVNHPLTDIGLERFLKDWEKVQGKRRL